MNKKFLVVVDEATAVVLNNVFSLGLEFVEVQGLDITTHPNLQVLVSPVSRPVPPSGTVEPMVEPVQQEKMA